MIDSGAPTGFAVGAPFSFRCRGLGLRQSVVSWLIMATQIEIMDVRSHACSLAIRLDN